LFVFFFQAEDGIRDFHVTGVQTCALPILAMNTAARPIMLCMKATSSGILVISTRLAMMVPAPPPTTSAPSTQARPLVKLTSRVRSEERRVGKECRSRGAADPYTGKSE